MTGPEIFTETGTKFGSRTKDQDRDWDQDQECMISGTNNGTSNKQKIDLVFFLLKFENAIKW